MRFRVFLPHVPILSQTCSGIRTHSLRSLGPLITTLEFAFPLLYLRFSKEVQVHVILQQKSTVLESTCAYTIIPNLKDFIYNLYLTGYNKMAIARLLPATKFQAILVNVCANRSYRTSTQ
ncbi:hypothetical protein BU24DRAFT_174131 [Aaosphaeria arxii CBS 175.79]|uniref:Uncharacterized protein n=1 Tax=Aaosphaeria arxii CBS 175.79 TaxID=1450172 RepID=A0A6A5XQK9_9PLEO|nr:uncharacterized protein BU24DRAFT_174131 [Aaosphaeria arxii CBS 175.79]KAF2015223.1 hypothetical protein BU24DRAFT_174131 [Aaosphaeria arxii CBS 175.79]